MTTKKVSVILAEKILFAPEGASLKEIYDEANKLWESEDRLDDEEFPFDYEVFEGSYRQTETEHFVAFEVELTERGKLRKGWRIERYAVPE
jgi:methyl coenzyme M reductase subunit D